MPTANMTPRFLRPESRPDSRARHVRARAFALLVLACAPLALVAARKPRVIPAHQEKGVAILVSIDQRFLWLVEGNRVIMEAPVAVGVFDPFKYNGRTYSFKTPSGKRRVLKKEKNPIWTVPEWHYFERATRNRLEVVKLERGRTYLLPDSTAIQVRDDQVGRVNRFGNFWPFTPGAEIIYYGTIYVPPLGTAQREVPNALGPVKLDMGEGYLIHGTHEYNEDSIGTFASHGCVRMRNEDVERLYDLVPVGTPVYIY